MALIPGASGSPSQFPSGIQKDTSGTAATAGNIASRLVSQVFRTVGVALTNNVAANITSLALTAGDWFIFPMFGLAGTSGTITVIRSEISIVTAAFDNPPPPYNGGAGRDGSGDNFGCSSGSLILTNTDYEKGLPVIKVPTSGLTLFLVCQAAFSSGTANAYGRIEAIAAH